MKTVTVKYNLPGKPPRSAIMEKFVGAANGMFKGMNGLLNKQFTYDEATGEGLSVYLWESPEQAEAFHSASFIEHFVSTFGVEPIITHHDILVFVDNRADDVVVNDGTAPEGEITGTTENSEVEVVLDPERPTVLITGSNRGIGLGLAQQYAAQGWNVIATARDPSTASDLQKLAASFDAVRLEVLDVIDEAQISHLAQKYASSPIDVLINNAGYHGGEPEDHLFGSYRYPTFERYMAVNTFAPLKLSEALIGSIAKSKQKKIVTITSMLSNLTFPPPISGGTFQLTSKAAVNRAMRTLQHELREDGITVALVSPGKVDTDGLAKAHVALAAGRSKSAPRKNIPTLSIDEASEKIAAVINGLDESYDGSHMDLHGNVVPW